MDVKLQDTLTQKKWVFPESTLKRLTAQPLNGSSVIPISSSGGIQTRVEIPACCERVDLLEVGYKMQMGGTVPASVTIPMNATEDVRMPVLPATYCSEFFRIEVKQADSNQPYFESSNVTRYSKQTSSLYNDFTKRTKEQRFNFTQDESVSFSMSILPARLAAGIDLKSFAKSYVEPIAAQPHTVALYQQQFIPLYDLAFNATTSVVSYTPRPLVFNYRLGDLLHDSFLNRFKHLPHDTNLVLTFYWNSINEMIQEVNYVMGGSNTADASTRTITGITESPATNYSLGQRIEVTNFFLRYYAEQNPNICRQLLENDLDIVFPVLNQSNISSNSTQNGCNLVLGQDAKDRVYRIYTSLYMAGPGAGNATRFVLNNNSNIGYEKWDNAVELYFNNDLYARFVVGPATSDFPDDWKQYFQKFVDGSLNSSREIENFATVVFDLDSDTKNGRKREYEDNVLKGKIMDNMLNVNPRFMNAKNADGNQNYTQQIFAVILKSGLIAKGKLIVA